MRDRIGVWWCAPPGFEGEDKSIWIEVDTCLCCESLLYVTKLHEFTSGILVNCYASNARSGLWTLDRCGALSTDDRFIDTDRARNEVAVTPADTNKPLLFAYPLRRSNVTGHISEDRDPLRH